MVRGEQSAAVRHAQLRFRPTKVMLSADQSATLLRRMHLLIEHEWSFFRMELTFLFLFHLVSQKFIIFAPASA